jgi:demethylmenaquinone methyltransferase/2-methoxy-6-polyprenyl-1,4-benzoquinol methylase
MASVLSLGRDTAWKRRLIRALPDLPSPVCIDLACGTGDLTRLLANRFAEGTIIGQDLTPAMLRRAEEGTRQTNVHYERRDMADTGVPSGSADIVTGGYALRNAPDLDETIAEIARILKPGGHGAFLEFVRWSGRLAGSAERLALRLWGSLWGLLLHRNPEVYGYIAASLSRFPTLPELAERFRARGLAVTRTIRCFAGVTAIVMVRKQDF